MPALSIDVVLTNHNAWGHLEKSVAAFVEFGGEAIRQIIIVDDASTAPARPMAWPPQVVFFTNPENRGYVASVNIGFRHATADLVLVFDADARPLKPFTARLCEQFLSEPKLGMIGFHTVNGEGRRTGNSCPVPSAYDLFLGQALAHRIPFLRAHGPACVFSCAMAVRREAFLAVNGFDEDFDFLDADVDFSMRLSAAGYDVREDDELPARHEGGGSPQAVSRRVLRHYRNRYLLLKKHGRLPPKAFLKAVVAARLSLEWLFLKVFGRLCFSPETLRDKIDGRRQLLACVTREWK
jgi:GT2 family glycosyltransferase